MNDLAWRRLKATLPPWINHHDAIETEESRSWVPPPSGAGVANLKAVHLAEVKRIKENKGYMLHFLEETEAEARTTERNKTFQLQKTSIHGKSSKQPENGIGSDQRWRESGLWCYCPAYSKK